MFENVKFENRILVVIAVMIGVGVLAGGAASAGSSSTGYRGGSTKKRNGRKNITKKSRN